jgi:AraC family transcriptional regulator
MEPKIVTRPAFKVVGMRYSGRNPRQLPRLWQTFGPRTGEVRHRVNPDVSFGLTVGYDERTRRFDYIACVEVERIEDIPEGMVGWEVPEQRYAVFPCAMPTFVKTYNYVKKTWIPANGYEFAGFPEFERYGDSFNPMDRHSEYEFYMPVK